MRTPCLVLATVLVAGCLLPDLELKRDSDKSNSVSDDDAGAPDVSTSKPDADVEAPAKNAGAGGTTRSTGGAGGSGSRAGSGGAGSGSAGEAEQAGSEGAAGAAGAPSPTGPKPFAWSAPALLENGSASATGITMTRNRSGDSAVAWWQDSPDGFFWMSRFVNGVWDVRPFRVTGAYKPASNNAQLFGLDGWVGLESNGTAQVLFKGSAMPASDGVAYYWLRWSGQGSVTPQAHAFFLGDESYGRIVSFTVAESGNATAIWSGAATSVATTVELFSNALGTSGWGEPKSLGSIVVDSTALALYQTASNFRGDFVLVTADFLSNTGEFQVRTQRSGTISGPVTVTAPASLFIAPIATLDDLGNATTVFPVSVKLDDPSAAFAPYFTRAAAWSNQWSAPERLASKGDSPKTTISPSGDLMVSWQENLAEMTDPPQTRIIARRYTSDHWDDPQTVADAAFISSHSVTSNTAGEVLVAWTQRDSATDATIKQTLKCRRFDPKAGWGETGTIGGASGDVSFVGLTLADTGRALVVWRETPAGASVTDLKWSSTK
ncbi:MAG TPA: hypothetical protein VFG30_22350 [Polyangiales bacterium]|nr:hypothetical protein [Polyangiales bacterium]